MYGSVVLLPLIFAKFFENTPFFIPNYQLPITNCQLEIVPHNCLKGAGLVSKKMSEKTV